MINLPVSWLRRRLPRGATLALGLLALLAPSAAFAGFGLTTDATYYTVDTGAGLVFKVRRFDNGVSTQSAGDIASLVYNGTQYQDLTRGTQVNSGFDYLYKGLSAVTVNAETIGTDLVKITVVGGNLTHYYLARNGYPHIYMGTYFTTEPDTLGLCRFIVRIPSAVLPNGPVPSDIRNNVGAVESGDVFKLADGTTRSKHYSNQRLKDWSYIGATGTNVGVWMVRDNNEGGSGGPFYRCLLNQCGSDQEITYIVNYGEIQTEAFRTSILDTYTLVFTNGTPPPALDTSWFGSMNLIGYVGPEGRGAVAGIGITGRDPRYDYTVGFANSTAQYWTAAASLDGSFLSTGMLPGTYAMTVYKNEFPVDARSVTVYAGSTSSVPAITIAGDPSTTTSLWRIGDWDGSPREFLNGDKVTTMHPSDVRMSNWVTPPYVVGVSTPSTGFPAYQWKSVNNATTVKFNLTADQLAGYVLRVGITISYAGARPVVKVNNWTSGVPAIPNEPRTRSLTVGSYRGNNVLYAFNVPASALLAGENTLTISAASGSSGTLYLSPGYSYDAVDFSLAPPVVASSAASGTWNNPFLYPVVATNLPTGYAATGLPPGLTIDAATGVISGAPTAVGTFTIALSASNANGTGRGTLTLTVVDTTPPEITVPADVVAEATGPDGAAVSFAASAVDGVDGPVPVTLSPASGSVFALGTTTVTATATDAAGNVASQTFTVTVRDTTPPTIKSVSASKTQLWPANHKMVPVSIAATATDLVSAVTTRVVAVTSNEPVDGLGDGDTAPDWAITGPMAVDLRAERSGTGTGRTYTVTVEARDAAGNASTANVQVFVPHDLGTAK